MLHLSERSVTVFLDFIIHLHKNKPLMHPGFFTLTFTLNSFLALVVLH